MEILSAANDKTKVLVKINGIFYVRRETALKYTKLSFYTLSDFRKQSELFVFSFNKDASF